ncbi:MAG: RDD family protein [Anaerolineae bacterium]|nr:RDD family protein [Anaerolineae bacterium]
MLLIKRIIALLLDTVLLNIVGALLFDEAGFVISFLIGAVYQWFFLTRNKGQTLGKMLLGIRVVAVKSGGKIGNVEAIVRYLGYYVNTIVLFLGWIVGAVTGRGFHDMLAGTKVVDA